MQVLEQNLTRGFQSSVDPRLHFGLGSAKQVDSLIVVWPDRRTQVLTNVAANRLVTVWQDSATIGRRATGDGRRGNGARHDPFPVSRLPSPALTFADVTTRARHRR